jgi:hypothetical protein
MPIILGLTFADGSVEKQYIPAEIWRRTPKAVKKLLTFEKGKELVSVVVDPDWETADTDVENNHYPRRIVPSRVEAFKSSRGSSLVGRDIMHDSTTKLKTDEAKKEE